MGRWGGRWEGGNSVVVGVREEVWTVQGAERWEHKLRKGAGKGGEVYITPGALTANDYGVTQTTATALAVVWEACNILRCTSYAHVPHKP